MYFLYVFKLRHGMTFLSVGSTIVCRAAGRREACLQDPGPVLGHMMVIAPMPARSVFPALKRVRKIKSLNIKRKPKRQSIQRNVSHQRKISHRHQTKKSLRAKRGNLLRNELKDLLQGLLETLQKRAGLGQKKIRSLQVIPARTQIPDQGLIPGEAKGPEKAQNPRLGHEVLQEAGLGVSQGPETEMLLEPTRVLTRINHRNSEDLLLRPPKQKMCLC